MRRLKLPDAQQGRHPLLTKRWNVTSNPLEMSRIAACFEPCRLSHSAGNAMTSGALPMMDDAMSLF
jgi:hypothetical protein